MPAPLSHRHSDSAVTRGDRPFSCGVDPLIRVICFLVFAASLALGGPTQLVSGGALLGVLYLGPLRRHAAPGGRMVFRIRWLLLALLVIYGWFTPGQPLVASHGWAATVMPTQEGLAAGATRALALVLIVLAVNALLRSTPRDDLLSAIYRLCSPLRVVGLSPERLAVRMVLTMDAVDQVRRLVRDALDEAGGVLRTLPTVGSFASELMREVDGRAARAPGAVITLVVGRRPPLLQWLYPAVLWALLSAGGML